MTDEMSDKMTCLNCRFWERDLTYPNGDGFNPRGKCRRRSPRPVPGWYGRPGTNGDDWCGEHEPRPAPPPSLSGRVG